MRTSATTSGFVRDNLFSRSDVTLISFYNRTGVGRRRAEQIVAF